jgi:hypothetical protein
LTRFPRRRARKALPPNLFPILTGWPFTKNVELPFVSSAFGLAMLQRGAPTRRASETVGSNNPDEIEIKKKKRKNFKDFVLTQMAASVVVRSFRFCPRRPLKNRKDYLTTIRIYFHKDIITRDNITNVSKKLYYLIYEDCCNISWISGGIIEKQISDIFLFPKK